MNRAMIEIAIASLRRQGHLVCDIYDHNKLLVDADFARSNNFYVHAQECKRLDKIKSATKSILSALKDLEGAAQ